MPEDGEALSDIYNAELDRLAEKKQNTWLTVPWLYSECGFAFICELRTLADLLDPTQMLLV